MTRVLKADTLVEYRDGHVAESIANGRLAVIVRQCSKQGGSRQYVVEIVSCPADWRPEHRKQQIGQLHFWWDTDFVVAPPGRLEREYRSYASAPPINGI